MGKPTKADFHCMDEIVAWCPVAKNKRWERSTRNVGMRRVGERAFSAVASNDEDEVEDVEVDETKDDDTEIIGEVVVITFLIIISRVKVQLLLMI